MISHTVSALISSVDHLPPLPAVAGRILALTADPESSTQALMEVVKVDQSLTMMILKMANSPFYGLARQVDSLGQALTLLGFREIRNIVLARAVFDSFKHVGPFNGFGIGQFWRHSFVCGLGARIIGAKLGWQAQDFFLAGLIHDIGKLVMLMTFPTEFSKAIDIAGAGKQMAFEVEKSIIGVSHDEVGMMLLKRWMFPESLIAAVGYHHRPRKAKEKSRLSFVIYAADILAHLDEFPEGSRVACSTEGESFDVDVVELFQAYGSGWDPETMGKFFRELAEQKERDSELLEIFLS